MKCINKTAGILADIFFMLLVVIGAALIILRLIGFQVLAVRTESMNGVYPAGSLIIVDNSSAGDIKVGDVISYLTDDNMNIVTHRVIGIDATNECFYTKGDENNIADANPVIYENLIGKVIFSVPHVGHILMASDSRAGRIVTIAAIGAVVLYYVTHLIVFIVRRCKRR